jgi:prepilin-type N-terminal cleavage/methylation domain-containing protein
MMLRKRRPRSAAFTLIELLVVIGIIALLVSLLMAAVVAVKDSGVKTENFDRIAQISSAIGIAKEKNHMAYVWSGPFNLKGRYATTDPELHLLTQMFPNMNHAGNSAAGENNGYTGADVTLDANQALLLLLTGGAVTDFKGFSNNPKKPFLPVQNVNETRKGPYLEVTPKFISTNVPGLTANGHPWLMDPHGTPYAVFAATKGTRGMYTTNANPSITTPQEMYGLRPYTNGGKYMNESGFQIVSAGKDQAFGTGGALPATDYPGGSDNLANFSKQVLNAGIN